MSETKVLNALFVLYFLIFTACSIDSIHSKINLSRPLSDKATKALDKSINRVQKLENSADALLNATEKYDNQFDKAFNIENEPEFASLTSEQKEQLLKKQQSIRKNVETQIEKIYNKSESIRSKAAEIEQQLDKAVNIAQKAVDIQSKVNDSTKDKTSKSFISSKLKKGPKTKDAVDATKIAQTCTKSFFESIPPTICWKKGGDVGKIPTGCPPGYFRYLALCFQNCAPGYSFDGGALCIADCPPGFATHPFTCFKHIFHWYGRHSYFPKSITNFEAPCDAGMYKGGALCYRDCNKIGMINCGIGMCASSSESCASGIAQMVGDVFASIGKGVGFVLSFGSSSAASQGVSSAKNAIQSSLSAVKKAAKAASSVMKRLANNPDARKAFMKKAMDSAKEKIKTMALNKVRAMAVEKICGSVHDSIAGKVASEDESKGFSLEKFDVLGVGDIVNKCKNPEGTNGGIDCAKSILTTLDNVDPTGLSGLAAAFMQPICDV